MRNCARFGSDFKHDLNRVAVTPVNHLRSLAVNRHWLFE